MTMSFEACATTETAAVSQSFVMDVIRHSTQSDSVTLVMMLMKRRCWMQPRTGTDMTVRCWTMMQMIALFE